MTPIKLYLSRLLSDFGWTEGRDDLGESVFTKNNFRASINNSNSERGIMINGPSREVRWISVADIKSDMTVWAFLSEPVDLDRDTKEFIRGL